MFGLCKQSIYYLILTVLAEVCALLIIGFKQWSEYFSNNYLTTIIGVVVYLSIIQLLCFYNKDIFAWILLCITFIANIISLFAAIGKNMPEHIKKDVNKKMLKIINDNKSTFDKNADESCKVTCNETCTNDRNKPIDFDCNSYCNSECNKDF